jgi:ribosomal protein S18
VREHVYKCLCMYAHAHACRYADVLSLGGVAQNFVASQGKIVPQDSTCMTIKTVGYRIS